MSLYIYTLPNSILNNNNNNNIYNNIEICCEHIFYVI